MIHEKRGRWCFRDANGTLHKFNTLSEAKAAYGFPDIGGACTENGQDFLDEVEIEYGSSQEESEEEETSSYKSTIIL